MREIIVKSYRKLDSNQLSKINEYANKKFGESYINNIVDKSLIGGLIIYDGENIIDASYINKLKNFRKVLIENEK